MSKPVLNDYLSSLQQQVAVSVDRLKQQKTSQPLREQAEEAPAYSYQHSLSERAYFLLDSEVSYQMFSFADKQPAEASYAAQSYKAVAGVDKPSTVLIDFMFAGNREFDFKV